jgi:hypothetical protein
MAIDPKYLGYTLKKKSNAIPLFRIHLFIYHARHRRRFLANNIYFRQKVNSDRNIHIGLRVPMFTLQNLTAIYIYNIYIY